MATSRPTDGSLHGIIITFASYSPRQNDHLSNKSVSQLKREIDSCGGSYTPHIKECTHMVVTPFQFNYKRTSRIQDAGERGGVTFVHYDWLARSLASKVPVDIDSYLFEDPARSPAGGDGDQTTVTSRPNKRARDDDSDDDGANPVTNKKQRRSAQDGESSQKKTKALKIPLDDLIPPDDARHVYVDPQGVVYDATLSMSDSNANNNKFYRIQVLQGPDTFVTWTRWGRVGDGGQCKWLSEGDVDLATTQFKRKFKDKTGLPWEDRDEPARTGKYMYLEMHYDYEPDSDTEMEDVQPALSQGPKEVTPVFARSRLVEPVQDLMRLLFNVQFFHNTMSEYSYDNNKLPVGKLSKKTLLRGYEALKSLATRIAVLSASHSVDPTKDEEVANLSNQYFSLVPHIVNRRQVPVLRDLHSIRREIRLLENLTDMQLASEIMDSATFRPHREIHELDARYQRLGLEEMTPLSPKATEHTEIAEYLRKSTGQSHNITYLIRDIFRIERKGEAERFTYSYLQRSEAHERRLLWHGSRTTNFAGILSQGLRIAPPQAPATGYMFGKGIYFADMGSKSANYCSSVNSDGVGLLLLCEVEVGNPPLNRTNADYEAARACELGSYISTLGQGRVGPQAWKDAGCVHPSLKGALMPDFSSQGPGQTNTPGAYLNYNEYIVYDPAQVRLRYLIRAKMF